MAFYLESQYLDLKKTYQNFSYEQILPESQQKELEKVKLLAKEQEEQQKTEIISQNTYLFVQEKELLQIDILNICYYFRIKHLSHLISNQEEIKSEKMAQKIKKFPFIKIKDRICFIIQKYQEQPVLLDSVMESLIYPIMGEVRLYLKEVMKHLGKEEIVQDFHDILEVNDLEPVCFYLASQREKQLEIWESKYVLLLWQSIIILVPFDLITIDSSLIDKEIPQEEGESEGIIDALIRLSKYYLNTPTKIRDASSQFLSNLFSRPDIQKTGKLYNYMKWATQQIEHCIKDDFQVSFVGGLYLSMVEVFKIGQRSELLEQIPILLQLITLSPKRANLENTSIRHLKCKLAQRIGMVYLRPRVVAWRYQRGQKNLLENMKQVGVESKLKSNVQSGFNLSLQQQDGKMQEEKNEAQKMQELDEQDYFEDVDEESLENIIDFLIENLRDKDTVVRWSAAKGLGRITSRLNNQMADDVVQATLELFSPNETENTWHGGCLTIGELSRRGLLLPRRLPDVFPIIDRALHFDVNQGNHHVGANVRDAACYISWAFARAYEPEVLKPYVQELSQNLLISCIYDREVNCRRAASASFQEHVGRQGTFKHGIEILTEADYFTLGLRNNAYLNVGVYVSWYQEYFSPFVEHLAFVKLKHLDIEIRKLSAAALALMTPLNPKLVAQQILPGLIDLCFNDNVHIRHGAVYGIGEILLGLSGLSENHCMQDEMKDSVFLKTVTKNERKLIQAGEYMTKFKKEYQQIRYQNNLQFIEPEVKEQILDIVNQIEKKRLFRGKGGEVMRVAVCRLIECISMSDFKLKSTQKKRFQDTIDECLKSFMETIQNAATKATRTYSQVYHKEVNKDNQLFIKKMLKSAPSDPNVAITRGYTRGLTNLSKEIQKEFLDQIFEVIRKNTKIKQKEVDDADTRKYAVQGIQALIEINGLGEETCITQEIFNEMIQIQLQVLNDYTTDRRGDIGSIVREASMSSMQVLVGEFSKQKKLKKNKIEISLEQIYSIIQALLQQLSEKIDRVRLTAGSALQYIIENCNDQLPEYPQKQLLTQVFSQENIKKRVQEDQEKFDQNFDTQVINMELEYFNTKNEDGSDFESSSQFIYYWNLPSAVFPIVVPLLSYKEYSYKVFKGLCISVGGITESVIKYSKIALTQYIQKAGKSENKDEIFTMLFENSLQILNDYSKDERVIVPLFNTLDFIMENNEISSWDKSIKYSEQLLEKIIQETQKTKSIHKLSASVGLIVGLVQLNNKNIQNKLYNLVHDYLVHKFPKVRKLMFDKFYIFLMSSGEDFFTEEKNDEIIEFLACIDFLDERFNPSEVTEQYFKLLGIEQNKLI
ncbi:Armadillo-type fold [Pseudocohnilembus persalinus]|uniref:Armadillo-type fold n=1 Tax=Pseudocohnilembus persalinus TaxID=266149 RepID=A0A0V0QUC3_PSEPJ|nr:Armadillo-type fold [Pseudocohnilembus persalinus]|eukprot:KRX05461.1 Armadillo-type fold [Pseudocohnilembus persalinus]